MPAPPPPYDENLRSERIHAIADLYYLYQHERIGIFRIVKKLQELFQAGAVRLSDGEGAGRLYQYDRDDPDGLRPVHPLRRLRCRLERA